MHRYSLDTNTLSSILRKDKHVVERFRAALAANHEFLLCPVVYYELRRGLLRKDASKQILALDELTSRFRWREFDKNIWMEAAQGWADACRRGRPSGDADLLIAYHAHCCSAVVVTANVKHFEPFPIQIENWAAGA